MPEDIGSMKVEYAVETKQALSHLNDMGRYLEMVAAAAEYNAEAVDQMADSVGDDLEKATSKYEKYGAAAEDYLKKVQHGWLVVTAAAVGMIYGLIRASSYGSMYLKLFGATTRQLADKIMEKSGLNDALIVLHENFQKIVDEGLIKWFEDLSTPMKAVVVAAALIVIALGAIALAAAAPVVGTAIWTVIAAGLANITWLLGKVGIVAFFALIKVKLVALGAAIIAHGGLWGILVGAVKAVGAILASFISVTGLVIIAIAAVAAILIYLWSKTESGQEVIAGIIRGWETFKETFKEFGFIAAITEALGNMWTWITDKFDSLIDSVLPWGKSLIMGFVDGIQARFPNLTTAAIDIYNTIADAIWQLIEPAYLWGKEFLTDLVAGVKSKLTHWYNIGVDIYNTIADAIWGAISGAWGWGADFISNLKDGIMDRLPSFDSIFEAKIPKTVEDGMDTAADKANTGGQKIVAEFEGMDHLIETDMDGMFSHWDSSMSNMDTGDTLEQLHGAFHDMGMLLKRIFVEIFAKWDELLSNMEKDITVDFDVNWTNSWSQGGDYDDGGWYEDGGDYDDGGGHDEYSDGGSWREGFWSNADYGDGGHSQGHEEWWAAGALGGHVARSGTATIHEGEDIVRLKQLLSGIKYDQAQPASVVISPTVNVNVEAKPGGDVRVIGGMVSDAIAKEVRRIMPIR